MINNIHRVQFTVGLIDILENKESRMFDYNVHILHMSV